MNSCINPHFTSFIPYTSSLLGEKMWPQSATTSIHLIPLFSWSLVMGSRVKRGRKIYSCEKAHFNCKAVKSNQFVDLFISKIAPSNRLPPTLEGRLILDGCYPLELQKSVSNQRCMHLLMLRAWHMKQMMGVWTPWLADAGAQPMMYYNLETRMCCFSVPYLLLWVVDDFEAFFCEAQKSPASW